MSALVMGAALSRLMREHGQTLATPDVVPLTAPVDCPLVLAGFASTAGNVDSERVAFAPFAFGDPLPDRVPLLHEHEGGPVGVVENLSYNDRGDLLVSAYVTDERARRCGAFSIGARIRAFELKNTSGPDFYAEVTCAELTDVSLVERPVNARARVLHRSRPSPASAYAATRRQWHALVIRGVSVIQQQVQLPKEINHGQAKNPAR